MNTVPTSLDDRFRAAAAAEGLLDVAYDVLESPVGDLFVGVSDRGLCVISYDTDAEHQAERSSPRDASSTSTSTASAAGSTSTSTSGSRANSAASCSRSSAAYRSARSPRTAR